MSFGFGGQPRVGRPNEILEFAKAWLGTALAFAVLFGNVGFNDLSALTSSGFLRVLLVAALTAGVGVILHELAHRVVARSFGADAYFVANNGMLVLSVILAFTGFLFAAPGAVWHRGATSPRQLGLIAAAGPIVNIVLALVFAAALFVAEGSGFSRGLVYFGLQMGFLVNGLLAVFNMIPFGPLDGAKVLAWSGLFFGVVIAVAAGIALGLPRLFPDVLPRFL